MMALICGIAIAIVAFGTPAIIITLLDLIAVPHFVTVFLQSLPFLFFDLLCLRYVCPKVIIIIKLLVTPMLIYN